MLNAAFGGLLESFMASWPLFYVSYLSGWLIALSLSLLGILLVGQNQIFLSAATAQCATLGVAFGLWLGAVTGIAWLVRDEVLSLFAMIAAVAVSVLAFRPGQQVLSQAVTGWLFLFASSTSVLLLTHSPHGLAEIQRLFSSSLLGATPLDLAVFAVIATVLIMLFAWRWRLLMLIILDPLTAVANGVRIRQWQLVCAVLLGLLIGLAIKVAGALFTFACLILPALVAKPWCRELRTLVWLTPLVALLGSVCGFVLANAFDYPPAQLTVVLLCLAAVVSAAVRRS
jgi:ABC-type Mn2+/Zn2+ transport system permease subunit